MGQSMWSRFSAAGMSGPTLAALGLLLVVAACVLARAYANGARTRRSPFGNALALLCIVTSTHAGAVAFSSGLLAQVGYRWGMEAPVRVLEWRARLAVFRAADHRELLAQVNAYWNRMPYADDPAHWLAADYWATPVEMLGSNGGDCEDYVFGKYFTLRELGLPPERLRMVYVAVAGWPEGHMVLAYYPTPNADPWILDNLTEEILPASHRADLQPIYSFNDDDVWEAGSQLRTGSAQQVRAWRALVEKMARERRL